MPCHTAVVWMQVLQREHRRVVTLQLDTVLQMPLLLHQLVHILPQPLYRRVRSHVQVVWGRAHAHGAMLWDVQRAARPHANVQCESLCGMPAKHACLPVFEFDLVPWVFDKRCISVIVRAQTLVALLEEAG